MRMGIGLILVLLGVTGAGQGAVESGLQVERLDCLHFRQIRGVEAVGEHYFVFRGSQDRYWLNRLSQRCVGLDRDMVLGFERFGSRLCALDQVTGRERHFASSFHVSCRLGHFEPVTVEQVVALEQMLVEAS